MQAVPIRRTVNPPEAVVAASRGVELYGEESQPVEQSKAPGGNGNGNGNGNSAGNNYAGGSPNAYGVRPRSRVPIFTEDDRTIPAYIRRLEDN